MANTMNSQTSGRTDGSISRHLGRLYQSTAIEHGSFYDMLLILALLVAEYALGYIIILKVPYTEIDWEAYMQEVEAVVDHGELDYRNIRGGTGPLVYPAGFVYLFALLRYLTNLGQNIRLAQFLFLGLYVVTQGTVLLVYYMVVQTERQEPPPKVQPQNATTDLQASNERWKVAHRIWAWRVLMGVLCLSKRLHSIFLLRLFNDGPTMLFLYMSILLFQKQHWQWGCFIFSLAVSIKMNVLLFAPGLLLLLLQSSDSLWTVIVHRLFLGCALPQLVLGAPFLLTHPLAYLRKAFELDRVFFHKWTVNFKFLPDEIFVSKPWALLLLSLHILGLVMMARHWLRQAAKKHPCLFLGARTSSSGPKRLAPDYIAYTMVVSNFVGIAFARTLHYQFYSWYFHALPLLMWYTANVVSTDTSTYTVRNRSLFGTLVRLSLVIGVMAAIEFAFLTFPATPTSSIVLQLAHGVVLWHIRPPPRILAKNSSVAAGEPVVIVDNKKTI